MTEKTKAKIDKMAMKATPMIFDGMEKSLIVFMLQDQMATPWAVWCDRFESMLEKIETASNLIEKHHQGMHSPTGIHLRGQALWIKKNLKEYRKFLEADDE